MGDGFASGGPFGGGKDAGRIAGRDWFGPGGGAHFLFVWPADGESGAEEQGVVDDAGARDVCAFEIPMFCLRSRPVPG
jgi:hypothetical protein